MEDNSKKYHLVPEVCGTGTNLMGYKYDDLKRISYSYLHGNLEHKAGYDIYSFYGDVPKGAGIYKGFVEFPDVKIDCTIFLWKSNEGKGLQGLVVANDDKESFEDAKTKYKKEEYFI